MSKIQLKTAHAYKAGQTNVLPVVGTVQFDEKGIIEVDESLADSLIFVMPEFSLVKAIDPIEEEDINKKTEDNDLGKGDSDESSLSPQTEQNDITGSQESVISENEPENEGETTLTSDDAKKEEADLITKSPEEIAVALGKQSVADIKVILANFPVEETQELKNKEQYIAYLVSKLAQ